MGERYIMPSTKYCCGCPANDDHRRCHWCLGTDPAQCDETNPEAVKRAIASVRIWTDVIRQKATRYFK